MRGYLWRTALFFGAVAVVPLLIGLISAFRDGIGFALLFFGGPLVFIGLVLGAGFCVDRGLRCAERLPTRQAKAVVILASPALLASLVYFALPLLWLGGHVGTLARLAINRDHYELIIARARADREASSFAEDDGVIYSVDPGPPVRVAFNPAGLLDNWSGIVFDPTGEVMRADGFDPVTGAFAAPEQITGLFGGDLVGCRHLWDSYYRCSFT